MKSGERLVVPLQYLSPVPPDEAGQKAMVLNDEKGDANGGSEGMKGSVVSVVAEGDGEGSWVVTKDTASFHEVDADCLVRIDGN